MSKRYGDTPAEADNHRTHPTPEAAALLLDLLRDVGRNTATLTPNLSVEALAAVARFREISANLATGINGGSGLRGGTFVATKP